MSECYPTPEDLQNLARDTSTVAEFVNGEAGDPNINRAGNDVGNLATLTQQVIDIAVTAGTAYWVSEYEDLLAITGAEAGAIGVVTGDPYAPNNGYWMFDGDNWVQTDWQPADSTELTSLQLEVGKKLETDRFDQTARNGDTFVYADDPDHAPIAAWKDKKLAVGVNKHTGDLVARYPIDDPRIQLNVDSRLYPVMKSLVEYELDDPRIVAIHSDKKGRALLWADYRELTRGLYLMGEKIGTGGGGLAGTFELWAPCGQSNNVHQAGSSRSLVYGEYYPFPDRVLMLGSPYNNIWLGAPGAGDVPREITDDDVTGLVRLRSSIASTNSHATGSTEGYVYAAINEVTPFATYDGYVSFNTCEGNQSITDMLEDAPDGEYYFQNQIFCTQKIVEYMEARGCRVVRDFIDMAQGEANTGRNDLGTLHNLLRQQIQDHTIPLTKQASPIKMISYQMSSFVGTAHDAVRSILAESLAQPDDHPLFICGGPTYIFPFHTDYLHNTSVGHAARGEYTRAIVRKWRTEGGFRPLHALSATVTGAKEITVQLSEEAVDDPDWRVIAPTANSGVTLNGGTIDSLEVVDDTVVVTTVDAASDVTSVDFALTGQSSPRAEANIPRCSIRSVASIGEWSVAVGGGDMYKPMCHQRIVIA